MPRNWLILQVIKIERYIKICPYVTIFNVVCSFDIMLKYLHL